jgi:predicted permease
MRALIMIGQVAIAAVLLVGSALLCRSFLGMLHADLGYDPTNVLTATMVLPDGDYAPERRLQAVEEVRAHLQANPGVKRAAYTTATPFGNFISLSSLKLRRHDGSTQTVQSGSKQISPGYFAALGQRVLEGREFTEADAPQAGNLIIVNRKFSRRYLDGRALGWTVPDDDEQPGRKPIDRRIIGVVEDTVRQSVTDAAEPELYYLPQKATILNDQMSLVVRTDGDPRGMIGSLRAAVHAVAPDAPLERVMTMEDKAAATLARPRLYAVLLTTFAVFALTIAGVGLFGVLSYTVAQRAREIGVRSALGAQVADIVGLVLRQSMTIAGIGVVVGLIASLWLARGLQKFLFGVTSHDLASMTAVALLLIVVAAIASIVPARRAARVDPVKVLRG